MIAFRRNLVRFRRNAHDGPTYTGTGETRLLLEPGLGDPIALFAITQGLARNQKENRQFLPLADKLYITAVHKAFEADCFFPDIDLKEWKLVSKEDCNSDTPNDFTYSYLVYARV